MSYKFIPYKFEGVECRVLGVEYKGYTQENFISGFGGIDRFLAEMGIRRPKAKVIDMGYLQKETR